MKLKGFICAALSGFLLTTTAFAENGEPETSQAVTEEEVTETEYIYSEIKETYDSYYRIYEEVFANQIVFYSNTANGALVEVPVKIDLPANVAAELSINGEPAEFHTGETYTDEGQYALTIKADGTSLVGGRENQVYYGFFRFRIMAPAETSAPTDDASQQPDTDDVWVVEDDGNGNVTASTSAVTPETDEPQESADDSGDTSDPEAGADNDGAAETTEPGDNPPEDEDNAPADEDNSDGITAQVRDDKVLITTENGTQFYCSVPPGTLSAGSVQLMFLDNTEYDVINGDGASLGQLTTIGDRGKYTVRVYDGADPAEFGFEVIGGAVRGLTEYTVPEGCEITSATLDGSLIRSEKLRAALGRDGTYRFEITWGSYSFTEEFVLDNEPPEFALEGLDENMKSSGSAVYIRLISDDIADYSVTKDGGTAAKKSLELTEPGYYTVTVYDAAGNSASQSFQIVYRMDAMAVVTIILGAAIVIAGVVFFIRTRRKFIVR